MAKVNNKHKRNGALKWLIAFLKKRSVQAALWKALAALCFASNNGLIKSLGGALPAVQVACLSYGFALVWLFPVILLCPSQAFQWRRKDLHVWRILCSVLGVLLWYTALRFVPLAQAVALGFLGPLVTMAGGVLFLKEKLTVSRGMAFMLSLLGGGVITHVWQKAALPTSWFLLLPIGSAVMFSLSTLLNKRLTKEQPSLSIVLLLLLPMTIFFIVMALPVWQVMIPTQWWISVLLGGMMALAHFAVTQSFACKDLLFVLPIGVLRFVVTVFIGWVFFAQTPDVWTCLGFLLILASLFMVGMGENRTGFAKR